MRKFNIDRDYYGEGEKLYKKNNLTLEPGLTVLVGCNGCGKTTLLKHMKYELERKLNLPVVFYDNLKKGGKESMHDAFYREDYNFVSAIFSASEGEAIVLNMTQIASLMGRMFKTNPDSDEYWILLDAVDSGLSIDNIVEMKEYLFKYVLNIEKDKSVYIVVSANEYEMARGEKCFDVVNCEYTDINSYEEYRNLVLMSRKYKDNRVKKGD